MTKNTRWYLSSDYIAPNTKILGSECSHVTKCLKKFEIRLKTYPKEWLDLTDEAALANPQSLSEAGFYCSVWQHGRAWIKCFSCTAHAGQSTSGNAGRYHKMSSINDVTYIFKLMAPLPLVMLKSTKAF